MVGFNTFFNKECPVSFVVRNNAPNKIVRVFRYPIYPGTTRDLISINYVSEADIKNSLLKGELHVKLKTGELSIESSNIDLSTIDSCHQQFLREAGLTVGLDSLGTFSVANLAELALVSAPDGAQVFVQTLQTNFLFNSTLTNTADGITIINGIGGKWERKNSNSKKWLTQTVWYINESTGNNENDGLTSATALASHKELERRLGERIFLKNIDISIFIMSNLTEAPILNVIGENASVRYMGQPLSTTYTGTVTTFTALNAATHQAPELTDSGMSNFSSFLGERVRITSGAQIGAVSHPLKAVSATTARMHPFTIINPATATFSQAGFPSIVNPANGSSYVIETIPTVPGCNFSVTQTKTGTNAIIYIDSLTFTESPTLYTNTVGNLIVSRCRVPTFLTLYCQSIYMVSSYFFGFTLSGLGGNVTTCGIRATGTSTGGMFFNSGTCLSLPSIGGNTIIQGGPIVIRGVSGRITASGGFAIFDGVANSGDAIIIEHGSAVGTANLIWGNGHAGAGFRIEGGARFSYTTAAKPTVTGATDTKIFGTTKTYAEIPFSDPTSQAGIVSAT